MRQRLIYNERTKKQWLANGHVPEEFRTLAAYLTPAQLEELDKAIEALSARLNNTWRKQITDGARETRAGY